MSREKDVTPDQGLSLADGNAELKIIGEALNVAIGKTTTGIVETGRHYIRARDICKQENIPFSVWVETETKVSREWAYMTMRVAEQFGDADLSDVTAGQRVLILLSSSSIPEDVREEFKTKVLAGEPVTPKAINDVIRPKPVKTPATQESITFAEPVAIKPTIIEAEYTEVAKPAGNLFQAFSTSAWRRENPQEFARNLSALIGRTNATRTMQSLIEWAGKVEAAL